MNVKWKSCKGNLKQRGCRASASSPEKQQQAFAKASCDNPQGRVKWTSARIICNLSVGPRSERGPTSCTYTLLILRMQQITESGKASTSQHLIWFCSSLCWLACRWLSFSSWTPTCTEDILIIWWRACSASDQ